MSSSSEGPNGGGGPRRRFPLGVTLAVVVAALLLVALLLPQVLLYPKQPEAPPAPDWAGELQTLKQENDKLAQQVAQLETLLTDDLCRLPDGGLQKPDGTPVETPSGVPSDLPLKPKSP